VDECEDSTAPGMGGRLRHRMSTRPTIWISF
jgi:hypothetical protein